MLIKQIKRVILTVLLPLLFMTGCWDAKDIEEKGIATLVILDKSEQGYSYFVELAQTGSSASADGGAGSSTSYAYHKAQGATLVEARMALNLLSEKELYLGAVSAVVMTENVAYNGIEEYMYRVRELNDYRKLVSMAITGETPESFEEIAKGSGGVGGRIEYLMREEIIDDLMGNQFNLGGVLEALSGPYRCFLLPNISIENRDVAIRGINVFFLGVRLGLIPWQECDGLWLIRGDQPDLLCIVPLRGMDATLQVKMKKRKLTPSYAEGSVRFTVTENFEATLIYMSMRTVVTEQDNALMTAELTAQLKQDIQEAIRVSQQVFKCDYLGFFTPFRIRYPVEFRGMDWGDVYVEADISVEVTVDLDATGEFDYLPKYQY